MFGHQEVGIESNASLGRVLGGVEVAFGGGPERRDLRIHVAVMAGVGREFELGMEPALGMGLASRRAVGQG